MRESSNGGLSRRERERLMRRRAMLRAAQAVFAEKGYARATLDEIAERAEFGKGTLYNYFEGGKEEILFAVIESIYDDICGLIREAFPEDSDRSLKTLYHDFVRTYHAFFRERRELFMIVVKETHRLAFSEESERVRFFRKQQERMVNAMVPALTRAIQRSEIQDLPVHAVAHMLLANANGILVHSCFAEQNEACTEKPALLYEPEHTADFLTAMLFDGLTRARPPAPDASSSAPTSASVSHDE